ncbi:twin-arginine translocase TatA/TatE family subunit [Flavobacteriales bacterium]|jgi:sec-independent protein translocase protein TatA|nr:twin-arginine translocase TatA/TatE family subunit [Flavobacteriales bacterium]
MNTTHTLLFLNLSGGEIFIIFLFILIFFGAESIPKMAKQFGKIMYQVKNATDDIKRDIKESTDNIKKDIMDQAEISNPIADIKKELLDGNEIPNPVKDIKTEIDNSTKGINL